MAWIDTHRFKVALSFSGERRSFVKGIADFLVLQLGKDAVFYDDFYEGPLGRTNLDTLLQAVYYERSDLVVAFICKKYNEKSWCRGVEWRSIRSRLNEGNDGRIMLVRFDHSEIEGLYKTVDGAVFVNGRKPETIAKVILATLDQNLDSSNSALEVRDSRSPRFRRMLEYFGVSKWRKSTPESDDKEDSQGLKSEENAASPTEQELADLREKFRCAVQSDIQTQLNVGKGAYLLDALINEKKEKCQFDQQAMADYTAHFLCQCDIIPALRLLRRATANCLDKMTLGATDVEELGARALTIFGRLITLSVDHEWVYKQDVNNTELRLEVPIETAAGMAVAVARLKEHGAEFQLTPEEQVYGRYHPRMENMTTESGWGTPYNVDEIEQAVWTLVFPNLPKDQFDRKELRFTLKERRGDDKDHYFVIPIERYDPDVYFALQKRLPELWVIYFGARGDDQVFLTSETELKVQIREFLRLIGKYNAALVNTTTHW